MHQKISLLISLCSLCSPAFAQTGTEDFFSVSPQVIDEPQWNTVVRTALDRFIPELDAAYYNTGIQVYDLTADSVLWAYHPNKVMRPASCQKLLTSIAALDLLGTDHKVSTRAYYTGRIATLPATATGIPRRILRGDLYVHGTFDPTYTYSDLLTLAAEVKALGIDSIAGFIYADTSFKDTLQLGEGWCWDDEPSVFIPYLCPLMFERGKLAPTSNKYPKDIFFNPALHFVRTLANELAASHIPVQGYATRRKVPAQATLFYVFDHPITELLPRTLKNSDNLYAEALFYNIAHFNTGPNATATDGARLIYNVVRKAGGNSTYCEIHDGCGLSPYDFVSPACLVSMLRYAYLRADIFGYIHAALPISGKDGTLSSRMKTGPAYLNVHAKTGTVTGVSSLSGYLTASNGHLLAFSIINNGLLKSATAQNLQDRICQELAR